MPIGRTADSRVSSSRIVRRSPARRPSADRATVRSATRSPVEQAVADEHAADPHEVEQRRPGARSTPAAARRRRPCRRRRARAGAAPRPGVPKIIRVAAGGDAGLGERLARGAQLLRVAVQGGEDAVRPHARAAATARPGRRRCRSTRPSGRPTVEASTASVAPTAGSTGGGPDSWTARSRAADHLRRLDGEPVGVGSALGGAASRRWLGRSSPGEGSGRASAASGVAGRRAVVRLCICCEPACAGNTGTAPVRWSFRAPEASRVRQPRRRRGGFRAAPVCDPEGVSDTAARPEAEAWVAPTWEQVVRDHSARVYRLAYRLSGNAQDAEDLTQETFVRVFRSLAELLARHLRGLAAPHHDQPVPRHGPPPAADPLRRAARGHRAAARHRAQPRAGLRRHPPRPADPGGARRAVAGVPRRRRPLRHRGPDLRGDRGHPRHQARHGPQPHPPRPRAAARRRWPTSPRARRRSREARA